MKTKHLKYFPAIFSYSQTLSQTIQCLIDSKDSFWLNSYSWSLKIECQYFFLFFLSKTRYLTLKRLSFFFPFKAFLTFFRFWHFLEIKLSVYFEMPSFQIYSDDGSFKLSPLLWYLMHVHLHWRSRHLSLSSICPRTSLPACVSMWPSFQGAWHLVIILCGVILTVCIAPAFPGVSCLHSYDLIYNPIPSLKQILVSDLKVYRHNYTICLQCSSSELSSFKQPSEAHCSLRTIENLPLSPRQWLILCPVCQQPCSDSPLGLVLQSRGRSCDVVKWKKHIRTKRELHVNPTIC